MITVQIGQEPIRRLFDPLSNRILKNVSSHPLDAYFKEKLFVADAVCILDVGELCTIRSDFINMVKELDSKTVLLVAPMVPLSSKNLYQSLKRMSLGDNLRNAFDVSDLLSSEPNAYDLMLNTYHFYRVLVDKELWPNKSTNRSMPQDQVYAEDTTKCKIESTWLYSCYKYIWFQLLSEIYGTMNTAEKWNYQTEVLTTFYTYAFYNETNKCKLSSFVKRMLKKLNTSLNTLPPYILNAINRFLNEYVNEKNSYFSRLPEQLLRKLDIDDSSVLEFISKQINSNHILRLMCTEEVFHIPYQLICMYIYFYHKEIYMWNIGDKPEQHNKSLVQIDELTKTNFCETMSNAYALTI